VKNIVEIIGLVTAVLVGIGAALQGLTIVVQRLPIAAMSLKQLFSKKGWKSTKVR
jgi:hypothetical protein